MTPEAFRAEVERFLQDTSLDARDEEAAGPEERPLGLLSAVRDHCEEQELIRRAKAWQAQLFDAGLAWVTGPPQYGGRGLGVEYQQILDRLLAAHRVPSTAPLGIGLGMVGRILLAHGSEAAKDEYLARIYRGDAIACQLFSEPDAGSDLASLKTAAWRDGEEWTLSGQKVWTSRAHFADIGLALCRSDPDAPKHRGITAFVVDLQSPGVQIRPLKQMSGAAHFNEVFLDDVTVPDWCRVGPPNGGWRVATATVGTERVAGVAATSVTLEEIFDRVVELAPSGPGGRGPLERQQLARLHSAAVLARLNGKRKVHGSLQKLAYTAGLSLAADLSARFLGAQVTADTGHPDTFRWNELVLGAPGYRLGGGTDEIQRTIIAERALGLPRWPDSRG